MTKERNVGGLRCGEVLAGLSDYLDGEMSQDLRANVDVHLAGCTLCERFGGEMGALVASVRKHKEALPQSIKDRLRLRLLAAREPAN